MTFQKYLQPSLQKMGWLSERALAQFEHGDEVEVIWRSFQLDPDAPMEYEGSIYDMLAEKKGMSREQSEEMHKQVTELAAQEGLEYRVDLARPRVAVHAEGISTIRS